MAANLSVVISAVDKASGVLDRVDKKAGGLSNTLGTGLAVAGAAAAAGLGLAVVAGIDFIKQAAEEEAGIKRLAAAVDANGGSWVKQGAAIEVAIQARQKLAFSDDELRSSLALLTAQTGDVDEAMRRQMVAMDLARGANIDLGSASKLLGKVTDESHGALSRLGIVVDKDADAMEVLAAVQKRFGGQSAAFADSASGKWARFGIAIDNIKESIGSALLPIVTQLGEKLAVFVEDHQQDIQRVADAFSEWASSDALPFIQRAFEQLIQLIEGIKDTGIIQWLVDHKAALAALGIALLALVVVFGGPIPVILALIAAGTLLLANWDKIRDKINEVAADFKEKFPFLAAIVETAFELIRNRIETVMKIIRDVIVIATALIHGDWSRAWEGVKQLAIDIFNGIADEIKIIVNGIGPAIVSAIEKIPGLLSHVPGLLLEAGKGLGGALLVGLKQGISGVGNVAEDLAAGLGRAIKGYINTNVIDKINEGIPNSIDMPSPIPDIHIKDNPIPRLAMGGIVTRPTLALIGERGPEAVVPLSRGGFGNVTLVFSPAFSTAGPAEAEMFTNWIIERLQARI